jgi:hypothetical protein
MKTIKICDKEYNIDCNAFTYVQFKKVFGIGLFQDIQTLKNFFAIQTEKVITLKEQGLKELEIEKELNKELLSYVDDFVEAITRIAYILIYTANNRFKNYEEFMKDIPKLSIDDEWIVEVTEFAVEKFC